ncbi:MULTISPECIES: sensor histidine kinase [unclassified Sphingobium]|uniref:sensor histidine kinase n=1 Tax=unclassified Sphingobium TaxID=2611147 RepID=UPI0022242FFE|nr:MULTISPECIES: HAMP domain-containing sensor histidine kinase [unclassified Sphingobium]MCW2383633.1 signal transduction histidine kinase [Sphingobium sp. B2D3D]
MTVRLSGLARWSISRQLGVLLFGALLLSTMANFLTTFIGPPPRAAPVQLIELAATLAGRPTLERDSGLMPRETAASFTPRADEQRNERYEAQLASIMNLPPSHVRLASEIAAGPAGGHRAAPAPSALFGSFSAAVRDDTGGWQIVRSAPQPVFTAWHRTVLLVTIVVAIVLGIGAALMGRGIVAPLHRLAQQADQAYVEGKRSPIFVDGPPEIAQLATTIAAMRDRFADLVESRTMMLAAIAHDMASPLARLEFRVARLPKDIRADAEKDLAELAALIASILAYAKGTGQLETGLVNIAAVARDVVDRSTTGPAMVLAEAPAAAWIWGDRLAIQRLIGNLVANAQRYAGGGFITIVEAHGEIVLTVADDGPGFPPALQERLFEPFFRVETSRSRETAGVGLGLAVARSIAEAHGGTLVARTRPQGGASFVLTLPASEWQAPTPA